MDLSLDLLGNALMSDLLLGGFYAAVTIGVSISFGMLDIVNIAHPAFILLGGPRRTTHQATTDRNGCPFLRLEEDGS
jgi:branched-subunit amino acid ABC-type transport system permease component